jgi:hypothetical protein
VIAGGGAVTVPPVVIVPLPVKVSVMPETPADPDPFNVVNEPVSPAKLPVALVIVADTVPEPDSTAIGIVRVPPRVLPEIVMVNGALRFVPLNEVRETVELKVPLPLIAPLSVAVPVNV